MHEDPSIAYHQQNCAAKCQLGAEAMGVAMGICSQSDMHRLQKRWDLQNPHFVVLHLQLGAATKLRDAAC